MHYVIMALVGLIVGILARFIYPGAVPLGVIPSVLLGIGGSYLAGFLGHVFHGRSDGGRPFHPAGFLYSIAGAVLLIFVFRTILHVV